MGFVALFSKALLLGNSDGRRSQQYHHPSLDAKLTGRILLHTLAASIFHFWSRECQGLRRPEQQSVPRLNVIEASDEYFGKENTSVSTPVASADVG